MSATFLALFYAAWFVILGFHIITRAQALRPTHHSLILLATACFVYLAEEGTPAGTKAFAVFYAAMISIHWVLQAPEDALRTGRTYQQGDES